MILTGYLNLYSLVGEENQNAQVNREEQSFESIEDESMIGSGRDRRRISAKWRNSLTPAHHSYPEELESTINIRSLKEELEVALAVANSFKTERDKARDDLAVFQTQTLAQLSVLNEQYNTELSKMIESHAIKMDDLLTKLEKCESALERVRRENVTQLKQLEREHDHATLLAVQDATKPLDDQFNKLRNEYEELSAKHAQLLGHQNQKQKIQYLKQLRGNLTDACQVL